MCLHWLESHLPGINLWTTKKCWRHRVAKIFNLKIFENFGFGVFYLPRLTARLPSVSKSRWPGVFCSLKRDSFWKRSVITESIERGASSTVECIKRVHRLKIPKIGQKLERARGSWWEHTKEWTKLDSRQGYNIVANIGDFVDFCFWTTSTDRCR